MIHGWAVWTLQSRVNLSSTGSEREDNDFLSTSCDNSRDEALGLECEELSIGTRPSEGGHAVPVPPDPVFFL